MKTIKTISGYFVLLIGALLSLRALYVFSSALIIEGAVTLGIGIGLLALGQKLRNNSEDNQPTTQNENPKEEGSSNMLKWVSITAVVLLAIATIVSLQSSNSQLSSIKSLTKKEAKKKIAERSIKSTPKSFYEGIANDKQEKVLLLLKGGFKDKEKHTSNALSVIAFLGNNEFHGTVNLDMAKLLLRQGADPNQAYQQERDWPAPSYLPDVLGNKSPMQTTPLILTTVLQEKNYMDLLLKNGANVNQPDPGNDIQYTDMTPLEIAAKEGYKDIAEILISNGANITQEIINTAQEEGNTGIELLLKENMDN